MTNKVIAAIIVVGVIGLKCIDSQILPTNPCPSFFQYFQNNGIVYGRMEFPNDFSGYYRLTVNVSVAAYLTDNENIRLQLRTTPDELLAGLPVAYHVYFPLQNVLPKPTRIEFNGRVYCVGPQEELRPGGTVTNLWSSTFYRVTSGPFRPSKPNSVYDVEIQKLPEITFETLPNLSTLPSSLTLPTLSTLPTSPPTQSSTSSPSTLFTNPTKSPTTSTDSIDNEQCGSSSVNTQTLVVNGDKTEDGQYPWLVAVMYRQNFDYKYRCTGNLVSKRHVITAAHCVRFYKALLFPVEDLLLVLGKKNIQNWANGAVIRDAKNVTVHPDYEQNKGDCDVAIITTDKPIEFQTFVRHLCLWQEEEDLEKVVGQEGTVVGWGKDETGKDFVAEAKKINLPIVSQVTCLRSDPGFSTITSSRTFCAGNRNGAGPCTGDSGAGFVMNRNGKWTLRGIVSTALGDASTCDFGNYFVFADVAKVKDWLREAMT